MEVAKSWFCRHKSNSCSPQGSYLSMDSINDSSQNTSISFKNLPKERSWGGIEFLKWEGFWYAQHTLTPAKAARSNFKALDGDVLLASSMKTGTTWLKALIPCIVKYFRNNVGHIGDEDKDDPLLENHPNALMPSLEFQIFQNDQNPDLSAMASPRLFRTHVPYSMLAESVKSSQCKIVYITRDPKDAFVSLWPFMRTKMSQDQRESFSIDEAFESFCNGVHSFGPFHDHVLGYWKEHQRRPEKIHFMKYEELKRDPVVQVQELACFLGRSLTEEEAEKVLKKCSLERLKELEVNKNGVDPYTKMAYKAYFRLGVVGDWRNHLSLKMQQHLDKITQRKLEGSGLDQL